MALVCSAVAHQNIIMFAFSVLPSPPLPLSTSGRRGNLAPVGRNRELNKEEEVNKVKMSKKEEIGWRKKTPRELWTASAPREALRSRDMQRWPAQYLRLFSGN